jgi:multiple sugar transport system ATP-binding protein
MVFQSYALYPHMTVAENMGFSLRVARRPLEEVRARVAGVARLLGLENELDRLPRQLSGGERQRVAIGRAIVREPRVFLFDEPLSNLDATLRVEMRAELKLLHRRLNVTTIFVTHDQFEAMTMADRIVVLNRGVVEQAGAPLELYDRPANRFVAGFLGSPAMNFFSGRIRGNGPPTFVSDGRIAFRLADCFGGMDGRRIVCGVRPEHFVLGSGGVQAQVLEVEPTGSQTHILARVGRHEVVVLFRGRIAAAPGERLRFAPELSCIHVFDEASGRRIALS